MLSVADYRIGHGFFLRLVAFAFKLIYFSYTGVAVVYLLTIAAAILCRL